MYVFVSVSVCACVPVYVGLRATMQACMLMTRKTQRHIHIYVHTHACTTHMYVHMCGYMQAHTHNYISLQKNSICIFTNAYTNASLLYTLLPFPLLASDSLSAQHHRLFPQRFMRAIDV